MPTLKNRRKVLDLMDRIGKLEQELYEELSKEGEKIKCDFASERIPLWDYIRKARPSYLLSAPVIYGMIVPALVMDMGVTIYQAICFPVYGIPKVNRREYIVIDRHRLPYLNALQKLNCAYCGYFNGLIAYVREIASRTEQFWCPIRHARRMREAHRRYWRFLPYGDGDHLMERWQKLRAELHRESEREENAPETKSL